MWRPLLEAGLGYLRTGGWVMLPLVLLSLWLWTLVFLKARELLRLRRADGTWRAELAASFEAERTGRADLDHKILHQLTHRHEALVDRHVGTILVLAGAAPLLGLLGTVTGMVRTFGDMAVFGAGNVRALSAGISSALVTTQAGLAVAIPGLFAGSILRRRAARHKARVQRQCLLLGRDAEGGDNAETPPREAP